MKLSSNVLLQILATLAQGLNQASAFVPDKYKFWVATGLSAIQMAGAVVAHYSNPNGTPAATPFVEPAK